MFLPIVAALGAALHGSTSAAAQDEPGLEVVVENRDGDERRLAPRRLDGSVLGPGSGAILRIENGGASAAPPAADESRATVALVGGERIRGTVAGGEGETLAIELAGRVPLELSIEDLRSVVWDERVPAGRTTEAPPEGDRLYWLRGSSLDKVDGTLEELTALGVRFDGLIGNRLYPWDEVAGLYLELLGEGGGEEVPRERPVVVDLQDRSRLRGDLVELGPDGCLIELAGGQLVALPLAVLVEVSVDDGSLAWLSDRAPSRAVDASPFGDDVGMRWPHRMDECVTGGPLTAGGRRYARGIGVHAPSLLEWELDGGWRTLRGAVALDDVVRTLPARADASVEFRVWLDRDPDPDGAPDWRSGVLRADAEPVPIGGLDLTGVTRLVLEVDPADRMHMGDRADWLRMLLVR